MFSLKNWKENSGRFSLILFTALSILFCTACSSRFKKSKEIEQANALSGEISPELSDQAIKSLSQLIESMGQEIDRGIEPKDELARYRYDKVKMWLKYFTERDRERFQRYLNRGERYKEVVQTHLEQNGIPVELYYMAMIESGYATHAYSRARAVGIWQFIAATGRRYGLKSNYYIDERRDPILATEAATKYLRDLYNAFLSWELSMAAYNTGELRILRAIMDGQSRDYWTMAMQKRLPRETRNYVPKFIAAALIGLNPQKYGFETPDKDENPFPSVVAWEVPSPIRLTDIAKVSGIDTETLKLLNPHIRRGITPPNRSNYEVWIPEEKFEQVKKTTALLSQYKKKLDKIYDDPENQRYHVVKRGENLSVIAQRYRVSLRNLKRINNLKSSRIYPGKKLRISSNRYHRKEKYRVQRGDTLGGVARRHGLSIKRLKSINGLNHNTIYIGQWLKVL